MPDDFALVCADCGQVSAALPSTAYKCSNCHSEWLYARYDCAADDRARGFWRYRKLLPVRDLDNVVTLGEGGAQLIRPTNLGLKLGRPICTSRMSARDRPVLSKTARRRWPYR